MPADQVFLLSLQAEVVLQIALDVLEAAGCGLGWLHFEIIQRGIDRQGPDDEQGQQQKDQAS